MLIFTQMMSLLQNGVAAFLKEALRASEVIFYGLAHVLSERRLAHAWQTHRNEKYFLYTLHVLLLN
jgi:hypothetical protein